VVDDADLEATTRQIATQLARGATVAYALAKENLNALLGLLERTLEMEREGIIRAGKTAHAREDIAAFIARRRPVFRGR